MTRTTLVALHVALPLTLGAASYVVLRARLPLLGAHAALWPTAPALLRDHFADAAWGWALGAFVSALWLGEKAARRAVWIAGAALVAAGVECLQYAHILPGAFDVVDLAVQVVAVLVAAGATGGMRRWITVPV